MLNALQSVKTAVGPIGNVDLLSQTEWLHNLSDVKPGAKYSLRR